MTDNPDPSNEELLEEVLDHMDRLPQFHYSAWMQYWYERASVQLGRPHKPVEYRRV